MTTQTPAIRTQGPEYTTPRKYFAQCIDELIKSGHDKDMIAQELGDALVDLAYPEQRLDMIVDVIANIAIGLRDGPYDVGTGHKKCSPRS